MKTTLKCIGVLGATLFLALPAHAKPEFCALDEVCDLINKPVVYEVNKSTGTKFQCTVTSILAEPVVVNVHGAGQYVVTSGDGEHEADPSVNIDISGKFKKEMKPKLEGKLIFDRVSGKGTVICNAMG